MKVLAADSATEVFLMDSAFRRIARGTGKLESRVAPGLYKLRFRSGGAMSDQLVEVPAGAPEVVVRGAPVAYASSAPLAFTSTSHEYHQEAAYRESRRVHAKRGSGSALFVLVRDPSAEPNRGWGTPPVELLNADGAPLFHLRDGQVHEELRWGAANIELDPGTTRVRVESGRLKSFEMFVVTSPGWQTQVFLSVEDIAEGDIVVRRPRLRSASVLMAPLGRGFVPNDGRERLADLALQGLASGRTVLSNAEIRRLADRKFENPMLGIYAAHSARTVRRPDHDLIATLCANLGSLVGPHPDVDVLRLGSGRKNEPREFARPPMLRSSWDLLVAASRRRRGLVPRGSPTDRVADGIVGSGAWLLRRVTERVDPGQVASRADARDWLDRIIQRGARENEPTRPAISASSTPLDRAISEALHGVTRQLASQPLAVGGASIGVTQVERRLAGTLNVPLVSLRRAMARLAGVEQSSDTAVNRGEA